MQENRDIHDDQEDLKSLAPVLSGIQKEQTYRIPERYFDELSDRILNRIEDMEVFEAAPVLTQLPKMNPFAVPDAYFEELSEQIQSEIRLEKLKAQTASEPALYFEGLAQEIESGIVLDKLSIAKEEPFAVPADYFDWLPARIQSRIIAVQNRARFSWTWLQQLLMPRVLVPAGIACLLLVFAGIRLLNSGEAPNNQTALITLTSTDKKEVRENPELYGIDESVLDDHLTASDKTVKQTGTSPDQEAAIDYLIDNNVDVSTLHTDNP